MSKDFEMKKTQIKNFKHHKPDLWKTDFAQSERIAFLASIPKTRKQKNPLLAPRLLARDAWMNDVSERDLRSVKAQLNGSGNFRADWWNLNCYIHQLMKPGVPLEQVMKDFQYRQNLFTGMRLFFAEESQKFSRRFQKKCAAALCRVLQSVSSSKRKV